MSKKMPDKYHRLLHRLWSKATDDPDYVKSEWIELEGILFKATAVEVEKGDRTEEP
jgi:hypothetical protein